MALTKVNQRAVRSAAEADETAAGRTSLVLHFAPAGAGRRGATGVRGSVAPRCVALRCTACLFSPPPRHAGTARATCDADDAHRPTVCVRAPPLTRRVRDGEAGTNG
eukprot:gene15051-50410_t